MKITIKSVFAALLTFGLPGIGQLFYGKIGWGVFWFFATMLTAGLAVWPAAFHCLILGNE
jgi:TM2 domain-containing membrane protein YozV